MRDRRLGFRIPFETMVTSYVRDRPVRGLAANLSDSGLSMSRHLRCWRRRPPVVGLELELPGVGDSIWASGRICYRKDDRLAGWGPVRRDGEEPGARRCATSASRCGATNLGALLARIRA